MKEAIFILLIVAVLIGLTAFRYRKQLAAVLNVWRMLKSMRQVDSRDEGRIEGSERTSGPLVNCAKCGTWVPETRAMKFGKNSYYCSAACVEKSARIM